tara:strand:- start:251 stop:367 length:117 start_codon:yes stop_codon:yes gene_type:complete
MESRERTSSKSFYNDVHGVHGVHGMNSVNGMNVIIKDK